MRTPVLVFASPGDPLLDKLVIAMTVAVDASLVAAEPGDDRAWLAFARGELSLISPPPAALQAVESVRAGFRAAAGMMPSPGGQLLPGLAIGDTSDVGHALDRDMKRSSLSHLTAVSGANCAIVVGLAFALCRLAGARRWMRISAALLALVAFVVLVTPEASVLRASIMAGAALLGLAIGRASAGVPLLCLSVVVLLAVDPWLAREYAFALSVLATAGLLVLAGPLAERLGGVMPQPIALVIAVPAAAQLVCQPVILLLDPSLAVYGVPANILAAPAAPLATVVGLLACLALPLAPWLAQLLIAIAWLPSAWIAAVAHLFAALPGARGPWPSGALGVALLVAVTLVGLVAFLPTARAPLRALAAAVLGVAFLAYPISLLVGHVVDGLTRPADWQYAACDVGQGDATLVRSGGLVALVDVGESPAAIAACLADLRIPRLDLLVLTHYDRDHVGGLDGVLGRVDRALLGPPSSPADEGVVAALEGSGARVEFPTRGARGEIGELGWELLWPPERMVEPGNAASLVLLLRPVGECRSGCLSGLLLGDLGEVEQLRILATVRTGRVDVVKVSHHGSADQSAALYSAADAAVGLIGVGAGNGHGHPTESLLALLSEAGTAAYRTDLHGTVLVAPGPSPGELLVWSERPGDAGDG